MKLDLAFAPEEELLNHKYQNTENVGLSGRKNSY